MNLVLKLMNSGTLPGGRTLIPMVDGALTIGRGEENDLALPDPDRTLSKRHCVLEERNGDYVLIDISTNGTFLNYGRERLGTIPTPLNNGDVIQVGSFELVVEIANGRADPRAVQPLPPADESALLPGRSPSSSAGNIHEALDDLDAPWDEIIGDQGESRPAPPSPDWGGEPVAGDPFADDPVSADPFGQLTPGTDPFAGEPLADGFSLDDLPPPTSEGASASDHRPAVHDHFSQPNAQSSVIPEDWDDLFAPVPEPAAEVLPEAPAKPALSPPAIPAAPPPPAPLEAAPAKPSHGAPAAIINDAARSFLEGAGMGHLAIPPAELPETMERMGRVMAAMMAGMREILMTRAAIKSEMRMERTMIGQGANNPLKFSISAEQAIEAMIRPSVRGYLDAETATHQALSDIRAHEVAMMSGMQAALKDLLARLGPDQLSERIESASTLGGLLGGKKARYWEAYEKMYAQIARETEDDFQSTFGREFARAYEEQLKKL